MNISDSWPDMQKILSGKKIVIPTWELKVCVTPMISIAGNIFSANTHYSQFATGMHSSDDLKFEITYDNIVLSSLNFLNNQPQIISCNLIDDNIETDHTLQFILSEKTDNHSYHTADGGDVSWILHIDLYIENLSMVEILEQQQKKSTDSIIHYMGKNGTKTLKIQTPIYKWLLTHEDDIMNTYCRL